MSNLLLKQLRDQGLITGDVLPFARPGAAQDLAARTDRAVMVLDAVNNGDYWVVTKEDAERLAAAGYQRHEA
ncbi:MAG: hypothetical protein LCH79_16075 [Proteobacteria bacterium]|nr:hypothetical protein [Pseudomonadota bacterium]